ncbi:MAG: NaeI family type II restriction endonuclease [Planctomycetota bacterium]
MEKYDFELDKVSETILRIDPSGRRTASVLRRTLDQLYDGLHTGRYRWDQLHKTEKTHCGTLVEINLHREFGFEDGTKLDYQIARIDVDCKYSQSLFGWMIPPETLGHLCIVVSADDEESKWHLGLVRIEEAILTKGGNRDAKRSITASGRSNIRWIFKDAPLPPNILLHLPRSQVDTIMKLKTGQDRVNEIFRVAQRMKISRSVIATLAQQEDYMKRVRGNGGARSHLKPEGIIVLGHFQQHQKIARDLGIPVPDSGELISVRLAPTTNDGPGTVALGGRSWRVAVDSDPTWEAPDYQHIT